MPFSRSYLLMPAKMNHAQTHTTESMYAMGEKKVYYLLDPLELIPHLIMCHILDVLDR